MIIYLLYLVLVFGLLLNLIIWFTLEDKIYFFIKLINLSGS
jgi:hypothetical protein